MRKMRYIPQSNPKFEFNKNKQFDNNHTIYGHVVFQALTLLCSNCIIIK